jgi:hypothetical protein
MLRIIMLTRPLIQRKLALLRKRIPPIQHQTLKIKLPTPSQRILIIIVTIPGCKLTRKSTASSCPTSTTSGICFAFGEAERVVHEIIAVKVEFLDRVGTFLFVVEAEGVT